MSPEPPLPHTIWHLAHASDWADAVEHGSYAMSTRGLTLAQVGFIHCAFAHQVWPVAALFYADDTAPLTLLGIDTERLAAAGVEVRAAPGDPAHPDGERFPHVFGAIPVDVVVETHQARIVEGVLDAPTWDGTGRD
jgi:glutathione S-transferase